MSRVAVSLIMCWPVSVASSFHIGVSRRHRIASSGRLARVLQRLRSTSSQPSHRLRHCPIVGDDCASSVYALSRRTAERQKDLWSVQPISPASDLLFHLWNRTSGDES